MMRAPAAVAAAITAAWRVSIETGFSAPASARMTGSTRRISSAGSTGVAPGRVDSPPISMRSAPASRSARARAVASPGSVKSPPSEKLSGVTLRMPMTRGRARSSPAQGRRGAVRRSSRFSIRSAMTPPCLFAQSRSSATVNRAARTGPSSVRCSNSTAANRIGPPAKDGAPPAGLPRIRARGRIQSRSPAAVPKPARSVVRGDESCIHGNPAISGTRGLSPFILATPIHRERRYRRFLPELGPL
jgi:hypothetical protein